MVDNAVVGESGRVGGCDKRGLMSRSASDWTDWRRAPQIKRVL